MAATTNHPNPSQLALPILLQLSFKGKKEDDIENRSKIKKTTLIRIVKLVMKSASYTPISSNLLRLRNRGTGINNGHSTVNA